MDKMIQNKYKLRKTGEIVEVIDHNTEDFDLRSENDYVSYIDSEGKEHHKERLNLAWDFIPMLSDVWEQRRYDLVRQLHIECGVGLDMALFKADALIAKLKAGEKANDSILDGGAKTAFHFTVDDAGLVQLTVEGDCDSDAISHKMYTECCKLQLKMLNEQSKLMEGALGNGQADD